MDVQLRADKKTNCRRETGVGLQNLRGLLLDHERAEKKMKGLYMTATATKTTKTTTTIIKQQLKHYKKTIPNIVEILL